MGGSSGFTFAQDFVIDFVRRLAIVEYTARLIDIERARSGPEVLLRFANNSFHVTDTTALIRMVILADRRVSRTSTGPDVSFLAKMFEHFRNRVMMMMIAVAIATFVTVSLVVLLVV